MKNRETTPIDMTITKTREQLSADTRKKGQSLPEREVLAGIVRRSEIRDKTGKNRHVSDWMRQTYGRGGVKRYLSEARSLKENQLRCTPTPRKRIVFNLD